MGSSTLKALRDLDAGLHKALASECAQYRNNRRRIYPDSAKHMSQDSEKLFSYGTLQIESVQLAAFGRKLDGKPDALSGYRVELIATNDHEFEIRSGATQHRNLRYTGVASDLVEGMVFQLTKEEIEQADSYEPWDYQRVQVELRSGDTAWVYLNSNT